MNRSAWRLSFFLLPAGLLAGCGSLGDLRSHFSRPEDRPFAIRPAPAFTISDAEAAQLLAQAQQLQARREVLRSAMAAEALRPVRMRQYRELHDLDEDLVPLQRRLRLAGRPVPGDLVPPTGG